ncbi:MAG: hypothetical protein ABI970_13895, partial [Chloroflexota bacterium]
MALMKISRVASTIGFMLLAACSLTQSMELTPSPPTPRPTLPQSTLVPTAARDAHTITTPSPAPSATLAVFDCKPTQDNLITHYNVTAEMQYAKRDVKVAQEIVYTNTTGIALSTIVLNVKTNWQPGIFRLQSIDLANGESLKSHLNGQQLEIKLPLPLNPACVAHINLKFDLHMPPIDIGGPHAYQGYLGYTGRQSNLGQWLPVVAVHNG